MSLIVFIAATAFVPLAAYILNRKGILDQPIARSSHEIPTPRGGGLALMPVVFAAWAYLLADHIYTWPDKATFIAVIACGILLCAFTWIDDHRPEGLSVRTRLLVQLLAAAIPLALWPLDAGKLLPDFVPVIVERALMAIAWVWFANLYNFMDGINGISASEAMCITGGILFLCRFAPNVVPQGFLELNTVPFAAAAGFFVWNGRKVAKIFLGDVGSVGFGYCLAWILFVFAAHHYIVPAVLVSLVYCLDASITLLKRAWQKKKIWQAHREHYYHRATVKGALSHLQCVAVIVAVNFALIGLAWAAMTGVMTSGLALTSGFILVAGLLAFFYILGKKAGHVSSPRPKAFRIERLSRVFLKRLMAGRKS